jgi:hypothetical protein
VAREAALVQRFREKRIDVMEKVRSGTGYSRRRKETTNPLI